MSLFLRAVKRLFPSVEISVRGYKCAVLFPVKSFVFVSGYVFSELCASLPMA